MAQVNYLKRKFTQLLETDFKGTNQNFCLRFYFEIKLIINIYVINPGFPLPLFLKTKALSLKYSMKFLLILKTILLLFYHSLFQ